MSPVSPKYVQENSDKKIIITDKKAREEDLKISEKLFKKIK